MIYGIFKMGASLRFNWIIEMVAFFCEPNSHLKKCENIYKMCQKSNKKVIITTLVDTSWSIVIATATLLSKKKGNNYYYKLL